MSITTAFLKYFSTKTALKPEEMREELKNKLRELDRQSRDLRVQQKELAMEQQQWLAKGRKAARDGDEDAAEDAYDELQILKAYLAQSRGERNMVRKAKFLGKTLLRKLEYTTKDGSMSAMKTIKDLISNPELQKVVDNTDEEMKDLTRFLSRELDMQIEDLERESATESEGRPNAMSLFGDLDEAIRKGDKEAAQNKMSSLLGDRPAENFLKDEL